MPFDEARTEQAGSRPAGDVKNPRAGGNEAIPHDRCGTREVTSGDDGGFARGYIPQAAGAECTRAPEPDGFPAQGSWDLAVLDLGRGSRDRPGLCVRPAVARPG